MSDYQGISTGSRAPAFSLPASDGSQVGLQDYYTKKNVYLFFVREFR
jgi:peroxiredoxin